MLPIAAQTATLTSVLQVASGSDQRFVCALLLNGQVFCAGSGITGGSSAPVSIDMSSVSAIDAGSSHFCAVFTDGTLACVGTGANGRLGYGNNNNRPFTSPYAKVTSTLSFSQVAAGELHTCALGTAGQAQCWGRNMDGQLGTGANGNLNSPGAVVQGLTNVVAIDSGALFACALLASTQVRCWGSNTFGQLGSNSATASFNSPQTVLQATASVSLTGATQIACGQFHVCALLSTGVVRCWGRNNAGQLGISTATTQLALASTALQSDGLVLSVSSGAMATHTCLVLVSGRVQCFGSNNVGQLGAAFVSTQEVNRVDAFGLNLARRATVSATPFASVTAIVPSLRTTCILASDELQCVGSNGASQLGLSSLLTDRPSLRLMVSGLDRQPRAVPLMQVARVYSGFQVDAYCAMDANNDVHCWGALESSSGVFGVSIRDSPTLFTRLQGARSIAMSSTVRCAILSNNDLVCWGSNTDGQLGIGASPAFVDTVTSAQVVSQTSLGAVASRLAISERAVCVLLTSQAVKCWGSNLNQQLGVVASITSYNVPQTATVITSVSDIQAGVDFFCALGTDNRVRCWGRNTDGQTGIVPAAASQLPTLIPSLTSVTHIACGSFHACALDSSGALSCWGRNNQGQAGLGSAVANTATTGPTLVRTGVAQVAAGHQHTCVILITGDAECWGGNADGQLGQGDTINVYRPGPARPISVLTYDYQ
jgi:alpha-tubulin suppressor-like RCC1 family protein